MEDSGDPENSAGGAYLGDLVPVDRLSTVTEAHIVANGLIAAGIPAVVADANLIQTDMLLTVAAGGVRVLVPSSLVESARHELSEIRRGAYELDGEDASPKIPGPVATQLELWPPDAAALWSFLLTPAFGSTLHFLNSRALQQRQVQAAVSLALGFAATIVSMYLAFSAEWSISSAFRASAIASAYTALWYLFSARAQSQYVTSSFGQQYQRRNISRPVAGVLVAFLAAGGVGTLLHEVG